MGKVQISWDDLWAWYEHMPDRNQRNILRQIDIPAFIPMLSAEQQLIVLRSAPTDVIGEAFEHTKPNIKKQFSRIFNPKREAAVYKPKITSVSTSKLGEMLRDRSSR